MTRFEAIVSIAQIVLRHRGQWHVGATAFADIDTAVNEASDLLGDGTRAMCEAAISELKLRSTPSSAECPHCHWGCAPHVLTQHIREKHSCERTA